MTTDDLRPLDVDGTRPALPDGCQFVGDAFHFAPNTRLHSVKNASPRCQLYRHFDADQVLLYLGITEDSHARARTHARHSAWAPFVDFSTGQWFDTRREAEQAEAIAIVDEKPLFNAAGATADRDDRLSTYLIERGALELLRFDGGTPHPTRSTS